MEHFAVLSLECPQKKGSDNFTALYFLIYLNVIGDNYVNFRKMVKSH